MTSTTPPPSSSTPRPRTRVAFAVLVGLLVATTVGSIGAWSVLHRDATPSYDDPAELFKYGSIGAEERYGIPWHLWRVLPEVCSKLVPKYEGRTGWESFGFVYEHPGGRPIGVSYREKPIGLVGLNCAACHSGTARKTETAPTHFILGAPARRFDVESYARFLFACGKSPDATVDKLLAAMRKDRSFGWLDELVYRHYAIPRTLAGLARAEAELGYLGRGQWAGPGRMHLAEALSASLHLDAHPNTSPAPVKFPPLWLGAQEPGERFGATGWSRSAEDIARTFALLVGATPATVEVETIDRVLAWARSVPVPPVPNHATGVEGTLEEGRKLYESHCSSCHDASGPRRGQIISAAEVGTDPALAESIDATLCAGLDRIDGPGWQLRGCRATDGYRAGPLTGLWHRAPFLHNGAAPTLDSLLQPDGLRRQRVALGFDGLDPHGSGYYSRGCDRGETGECFRAEIGGSGLPTTQPGTDQRGHRYGEELDNRQRAVLALYLNTL